VCGEATSFSILEAMSAGCAVVATNMFGIITEIMSMHNGVLCFPHKDSLIKGVKFLIENPHKRLEIQKNAWKSCQNSFSLDEWKERWKSILLEVVNGKERTREKMEKRTKRFYYFL
jgi:glycosyltransferase involved in cell wall biosynthesis